MNPDKLFDYLEGKLGMAERTELEARLISDPELQRELAVARQIHRGMRDSDDVAEMLPRGTDADRGAVLVRRVAITFGVLVFLNVLFGIYAIGFLQNKRKATKPSTAAEQELQRALQNAAATALPTPRLEVNEIKVPAAKAQRDAVAEKIIAAATECGGSAAKNLNDENGLLLFAEIPAPKENDFREKLTGLGAAPSKAEANSSSGNRILQIRVVD
jgi:hypothetical protein